MAEWLVWIKDLRLRPGDKTWIRRRLTAMFEARGISLVGEPSVVVPPEKHVAEWCVRVRANLPKATADDVTRQVQEACEDSSITLMAPAQAAPAKVRHLRSVKKPA
jgi:hypothetical protein